jgi:hypothetical protein
MRRKCTTEEELMDYLEGRLSDKARARVERHLSECDLCLEELGVARKLLDPAFTQGLESAPESATRRAIRAVKGIRRESFAEKVTGHVSSLVSQWVSPLSRELPRIRPAFVPVRGTKKVVGEDLVLLRKTFADLDVDVEIEKTGENKASIVVRLTKGVKPKSPLRVTLVKRGREIASLLCQRQGAYFEDVAFGRYVLVFTMDGVKAGEYRFEIKETRGGSERRK